MGMNIRTIAAAVAGLVLGATLATAPGANAGSVVPGARTLDALPQCETITDLNCQATVMNVQAGDQYVQIVNGAVQHEDVWPFRNPTAGPIQEHVSDEQMFPFGYAIVQAFYATHQNDDPKLRGLRQQLTNTQWRAENLHEAATAAHEKVVTLRRTNKHLRAEIRHLRHRLGH